MTQVPCDMVNSDVTTATVIFNYIFIGCFEMVLAYVSASVELKFTQCNDD